MTHIIGPTETQFIINLALSVLCGYLIGAERESRGKDAGISTHVFVLAGAMLFTFVSALLSHSGDTRIASQIVSGIGFLGAGLILKDGGNVKNLTTAASVWYAGAIGMAIGFGLYAIAGIASLASVLIPRIPHIKKRKNTGFDA